nr:hypothetical protein [Spirochaetota bacterium]
EATCMGGRYILSFAPDKYGSSAGEKTIDLLISDHQGNDYETQLAGVPVYMNDQNMYDLDSGSGAGSWLRTKFNAHPHTEPTTFAYAPSNTTDVDGSNTNSDYYEILLVSSDTDQSAMSSYSASNKRVVTPVKNSTELETKINELDLSSL